MVVGLLLTAAALSVFGATGCGKDVRRDAGKAAKRGNWPEAARLFREFLSEHPGRNDIRRSLAAIECHRLKVVDECLEHAEKLISVDVGDTAAVEMLHFARYMKAVSFLEADRIVEARAELHKAADAFLAAARYWYEREWYSSAVGLARRATELNPNGVELWMWLGTMEHTFSGVEPDRADSAIVAFRRAIKLAPYNVDARRNLMVVYYEAGRYDDADDAFNQLVRVQQSVGAEPALVETTSVARADSGIIVEYVFPTQEFLIPSW